LTAFVKARRGVTCAVSERERERERLSHVTKAHPATQKRERGRERGIYICIHSTGDVEKVANVTTPRRNPQSRVKHLLGAFQRGAERPAERREFLLRREAPKRERVHTLFRCRHPPKAPDGKQTIIKALQRARVHTLSRRFHPPKTPDGK